MGTILDCPRQLPVVPPQTTDAIASAVGAADGAITGDWVGATDGATTGDAVVPRGTTSDTHTMPLSIPHPVCLAQSFSISARVHILPWLWFPPPHIERQIAAALSNDLLS